MEVKVNLDTIDDLIWMSMRYCIGRKSIAAGMHPDSIKTLIEDNPEILTKRSGKAYADLIYREINEKIHWQIEVSVEDPWNGDAYTPFLLNFSPYIKGIIIKASTGEVDIETQEQPSTIHTDYIDLISWLRLANWLNKSLHKRFIYTREDGLPEVITVYPAPVQVGPFEYKIQWYDVNSKYISSPVSINTEICEEIK